MTSISRSGGVLAILDGSLEFKETRLSSESMNRWIGWIQVSQVCSASLPVRVYRNVAACVWHC